MLNTTLDTLSAGIYSDFTGNRSSEKQFKYDMISEGSQEEEINTGYEFSLGVKQPKYKERVNKNEGKAKKMKPNSPCQTDERTVCQRYFLRFFRDKTKRLKSSRRFKGLFHEELEISDFYSHIYRVYDPLNRLTSKGKEKNRKTFISLDFLNELMKLGKELEKYERKCREGNFEDYLEKVIDIREFALSHSRLFKKETRPLLTKSNKILEKYYEKKLIEILESGLENNIEKYNQTFYLSEKIDTRKSFNELRAESEEFAKKTTQMGNILSKALSGLG